GWVPPARDLPAGPSREPRAGRPARGLVAVAPGTLLRPRHQSCEGATQLVCQDRTNLPFFPYDTDTSNTRVQGILLRLWITREVHSGLRAGLWITSGIWVQNIPVGCRWLAVASVHER